MSNAPERYNDVKIRYNDSAYKTLSENGKLIHIDYIFEQNGLTIEFARFFFMFYRQASIEDLHYFSRTSFRTIHSSYQDTSSNPILHEKHMTKPR